MEELELLKRDWNKKSDDFKEYSDKDIHGMIKKQSVSVTKTLIIIGLIELILWAVYGYIEHDFSYIRVGLFVIFFAVTIYFFAKIKTDKDSTSLMKSILNLRKVIFGYAGISFLLIVLDNIINFEYYTKDFLAGVRDGGKANAYHTTNPENITPGFINYIVFGVVVAVVMYLLYWIYKKTYGKILFDLKKNYKELSKVE